MHVKQVSKLCDLCLTFLDPCFSVSSLQGMPPKKPAPEAGPGRAREVSRVRRRHGPATDRQLRRPPVSAAPLSRGEPSPGGPPSAPTPKPSKACKGAPRCPHCSGQMCRLRTAAPQTPPTPRGAPHAWDVPPLMERTISFLPGECPPLSRSYPAPPHGRRRPDRRAAPGPSSRDPPGRPPKRRRDNRRPEASEGRPPSPQGEMEPPTHSPVEGPQGRHRRNRPGSAQRRRWRRNASREAVEADLPEGAGPSPDARVPEETDLPRMVTPLLPLPSSPGRGSLLLGWRTLLRAVLPQEPPAPLPQAEGVPLLAERTPPWEVLPRRPLAPRPQSTTTPPRQVTHPWGLPPRCLSLRRSWRESTRTWIWTAASPCGTGLDAVGGRCQICDNTSYD